MPNITSATIEKDLEIKESSNKNSFKANLVLDSVKQNRFAENNYTIDIIETNKIDDYINIKIRVFDKNGQLGFSKDGSVDIESINIINPPVLIPDKFGLIDRLVTFYDPKTNSTYTKTEYFTYDPQKALQIHLSRIIDKIPHTHNEELIVKNKVGKTVTTIYTDADVETSSVDGYVESATNSSWDTVHDASSGNSTNDTNTYIKPLTRHNGSEYDIIRAFILFDTSTIPDADTINSAVISLYPYDRNNQDNDAQSYISVVSSTPTSNTTIATGDYNQVGSTNFASINISSFTLDTYNDFTLNASGISNIDKTGVSKFGLREGHDLEDTVISNGDTNNVLFRSADQTGTVNDPMIVITHEGDSEPDPVSLNLSFGVSPYGTTTCTHLSASTTECVSDNTNIIKMLGSITFGIAIILVLAFLGFIGYLSNKLSNKKIWH